VSDPRIAAANPNLKLPDMLITVVRRSDSSGTTFVFTKHLSAIYEAFAKEVGTGTTVQWPKSDKIVAAPKNDGITATIKQTPGAIGYIEYGYAKLTKADFALLQNKAGDFILADTKSGQATLATATFDSRLRGWIEDPPAADAYPIATFTWLLAYKKQDARKAEWMRKLVEYCVTTGQSIADSMGYIPLPANAISCGRSAA
jgi:phosphate transport system substrate-binding protein